jgi:hypothetical protein
MGAILDTNHDAIHPVSEVSFETLFATMPAQTVNIYVDNNTKMGASLWEKYGSSPVGGVVSHPAGETVEIGWGVDGRSNLAKRAVIHNPQPLLLPYPYIPISI